MKTPNPNQETGSAIVLVISILATLMVIVGVALDYTSSIRRNVQRSTTLENAITVANGVLDNNYGYWRAQCRKQASRAWNSNELAGLPLPTQTQFPNIPNFSAVSTDYDPNSAVTVQQCKTIAADPELNPIDPAGVDPTAVPIPGVGPTTAGVSDPKTTAIFNYLSTAYVTLPALRGNLVAKVQRVFQKEQVSPWNYAIFYVDPLEMHPGPPFYVTGWVHTNSDLYTGHNTLNFMDKVTFSGEWTKDFKSGDPRAPDGNAREIPTVPHWQPNLPPQQDDNHEPFGLNPSDVFDTTDSNPNNDGYHELVEPPVLPLATNPDPLDNQRYYDQAGVVIKIDASNTVSIQSVDSVTHVATTVTSGPTYDMFKTSISTGSQIAGLPGAIVDNREGATIRVATLDISQITQIGIGENGIQWRNPAFNGIVYIYDSSAAPSGVGAKRGIRLKNGTKIPKGGLTVASGNPVYIQGDFNTGGTGITVPSNQSNAYNDPNNPFPPQVPGYTREPCSVLADAVNLLSSAWTDANSGTSPPAVNTTFNTAIISGIVPSVNNNYSGGAENFPRFLETWGSGRNLTYYGSMVELYNSQQSIGKWGKPNVYDPPSRRWYFDTNFRLNTPPGSLMVYTFRKGQWTLVP